MKKMNKKGFTLAELLIVVAIIAVLVAIAIPVFNAQLEKSREVTDAANIRSAYAEIAASALTDPNTTKQATVGKQQKEAGWVNKSIDNIAGVAPANIESLENSIVKYDASTGKVTIDGNEVKDTFVDTQNTTSSDTGNESTGG